jgi:Protein of unknown function (DUF3800)
VSASGGRRTVDICYVDESGSADLLCEKTTNSTPILAIGGLIVPGGQQLNLAWDFLQLKKIYNPSLARATYLSEVIRTEVKGSDLRADLRAGTRRRRRRAIGFLDKVFTLVERYQCRLVGRVWVKDLDVELIDRKVYSSGVGWIGQAFHQYLDVRDQEGLVLLDSRTKVKNTPNVDGVTTQRLRHGGNAFPRLCESPVFGHSDSHVVLQIADVIVSALMFPCACAAYCSHLTWNDHARPEYEDVRARYGQRLKDLQYRYFDQSAGQWRGGLYVTGSKAPKSAALFVSTPLTVPLPLAAAGTIDVVGPT